MQKQNERLFLLIFIVPAERQTVNKMHTENCIAFFLFICFYFIIPDSLQPQQPAHYTVLLVESLSSYSAEESHR